ncbi:MAG: N-acetylmuramoyl-L-alanine amidase [Pseudomonadota bacterium]
MQRASASLGIVDWPSPNHGPRRGGPVDMVVLHYTAMESAEAAARRLADPAAEVSAHYLIGRCGTVLAMVPEDRRAWHAGRARWGAVEDVNSRSIGIELDNEGAALSPLPPFAELQMAALERLLGGLLGRHPIPPERVLGHACISPGRKIDPGAKFDWRRLAAQDLAIWLDPSPAALAPPGHPGDVVAFAQALSRLGYAVPPGAARWEALLSVWQAFAMRFLPPRAADPWAGPAAVEHAEALAARWPSADGVV